MRDYDKNKPNKEGTDTNQQSNNEAASESKQEHRDKAD